MPIEVVMPQLGLSMDSGHVAEWFKQSGEQVRPGELLLAVESDKSTVDVEAVGGGILHIVVDSESGDIPVGAVIAYLLQQGEQPPETGVPGAAESTTSQTAGEPSEAQTGTTHASQDTVLMAEPDQRIRVNRPPSSPAARRRAAELGLDWREAVGTGPAGRIKERDVIGMSAQAEPASKVTVPAVSLTPVAERMATAAGLDVNELARRYPGQRIGRKEVESTIKDALHRKPQTLVADRVPAGATSRREKMGRLRTLIAHHMAESSQTTAPVTLTTEADATELVRMREALKNYAQTKTVPSYNALLARLVAQALVDHPALNASIDGEEIVFWENVNIGTAVDTEHGLIVPVIHDVQTKSVQEISEEMAELLPRAKAGHALPDELSGGTFTVTNLGQFEIDTFTPIINGSECAILGVGRLVEKYVVKEGQPRIRTMIALSLTFDHRLVDGGPAASFLQRIKHFVEVPYLWLG